MDILASSEEQKAKLESDYQKMLAIHDVVDTLQIKEHKKIHDIYKWSDLSLGNIFTYILQKKNVRQGLNWAL